MKNKGVFLSLVLMLCFSCKSQILQQGSIVNVSEYKTLIIGELIADENNADSRDVYLSDSSGNLLISYDESTIYKTYSWNITGGRSESGVVGIYLERINTTDSSDLYVHEIIGLSDTEMYLQWLRADGQGVGKVVKYTKI